MTNPRTRAIVIHDPLLRQRHAQRAGSRIRDTEPASGRDGFSIIEVMTLLAVLGIVTAMAAPRLDFHYFQIRGEMQAVSSTLMAAQRTAVQQQHNVVVAFDTANTRVRVHADGDNDRVVDPGERVTFQPLGTAIRFGSGGATGFFATSAPVSFDLRQDGMPAVVFYRNGAASEEGGFYLTSARATASSGHAKDTRALRIERSTGRPTWFSPGSPSWKQEF